ncbi:hypothetical protein NLJ89_g5061 [Agrocybe chaxingu]|uniref:F-box protein n=1 Tax=Agrocybe chaxingu TaxID=84603 RepID=A0A9W8MVD2_9AGAR|nr:hypothetical protein NLJ89_g5061 [Agrocybe chaxingu]
MPTMAGRCMEDAPLWKYAFLLINRFQYCIQVELFEAWLQRAKTCRLSITLRFEDWFYSQTHARELGSPYEIFELIAMKSGQLEAIDLVFPDARCAEILNNEKESLSSLRFLCIKYLETGSPVDVGLMEDQVSLKHLVVNLINANFTLPRSCFSLSMLDLKGVDLEMVVAIIRMAPNLRTCRLKEVNGPESPIFDPSPVTAPSLESLEVRWCYSFSLPSIFGELPNLSELIIRGNYYPCLEEIKRFFDMRSLKLKRFHLTIDETMKLEGIRGLLNYHNITLVSLSFHNHSCRARSLHEEIHQMLTPRNGNPDLLPNLQHYEYHPPKQEFFSPLSMACLVHMLKERWEASKLAAKPENASPAVFSVRLPYFCCTDILESLETEREEGLRIETDLFCKGES